MADIAADDTDALDCLRARVAALEAELALLRGSLAPPSEDSDGYTIVHNVPPSDPR